MKILKTITLLMLPPLITIIKSILFVPVNITGGIAGLNELGYVNLFSYYGNKLINDCSVDCLYYELIVNRYIIETIITFVLSLVIIIIIIILSNRKKKGK